MTEDDNVNIKLEVFRDKTSGKLSIMAHFNSDAPNVFKDKDSYFWVPTIKEKDLINEAFGLISIDTGYTPSGKTLSKPEEIKEETSTPDPVIEEGLQTTPETLPTEDEKKSTVLSSLEKPEELAVFEVTGEGVKTDDLDKNIDKKTEDTPNNVDVQTYKEPKSDESDNENKEENEGIIVEANSEAIDTALKKHIEKDKSMVEADEQTIVDKVLSQKKKGKWSRR